MMRKLFTFLFAALMSVGMWADPIVVEWNGSDLPEYDDSFSKDGVTLECDIDDGTLSAVGTFTTTLGNFTKIEVTADDYETLGPGWSGWSGSTWNGSAASVDFYGDIMDISSIVFTIEPGSAPAGPSWVREGDEWDDASKTLTVNRDLPAYAYEDQTEIEHLIISNNVTSIGGGAFGGYTDLKSIEVASGNTKYDSRGNCNAIIETASNTLIKGCKNTIIPTNVTSIGGNAFCWCTGLTSITIPNSVTSIGEWAFGNSGLTSVTIGNSVTSIGESAFDHCAGLTSITIPNSVESIEDKAFIDCTNITDVYCYPNAANLTWNEAGGDFKASKATRCHVPAYCYNAYVAKFDATVNVTFVGDLTLNITANQDPQNASVYYSTFFDSAYKYELPDGVEAYVADLSGSDLVLTKIAEAGQVIPNDNAVILKAGAENISLIPTDATPVSFSATNDLEGVDAETAVTAIDGLTTANCYVLSGTNENGVGFYRINSENLKAHKAYVKYSGTQNNAPKKMRFVFNTTTGVESAQPSVISGQKLIENGQLIIIKNGVRYNAQGQIVK